MGKVGLQLFSVWRDAEKDFLGTFQKVIYLGYEGIQFAGFHHTPAESVKNLLAQNKTLAAGSYVGMPQLSQDELGRTFEYHHIIQNKLIICPALPKEMRLTSDDYKRSAELLNQLVKPAKKPTFILPIITITLNFKHLRTRLGWNCYLSSLNSAGGTKPNPPVGQTKEGGQLPPS